MPERILTGTRLRQRRIDRGLRQADLARLVGISPSYLNLIEHNRRRIGGKLLSDLARALGLEPDALIEGLGPAARQPLAEVAAEFRSAAPEEAQIEDLVARFPGWAGVIGAQWDRIRQLEGRVQMLTDRLTHDPQVASSLHDILSTVTAIRSTASILVESRDLDADWQDRFHRNIEADSRRLSESSQALTGYLEANAGVTPQVQSPLEIAEGFMARQGYHFPELEAGGDPVEVAAQIADPLARQIVESWLARYARDAAALPLEAFADEALQAGHDPEALSARLQVPPDLLFRRLAALPEGQDHPVMGLAICDQAGVLIFQKPVMGFALPRSAAGCPLWPLYQALTQPGRALRQRIGLPGAGRGVFECAAIATDLAAPGFERTARVVSTMLLRPVAPRDGAAIATVGPGCRVCPVVGCASRRQPSILSDRLPAPLTGR